MAHLFGPFIAIAEWERHEQRNRARLYKRTIRDAQNPFAVSENEFQRHFRLSKEAAWDVVEALSVFMEPATTTVRIPKAIRVLAMLNFLATGSYQRSVASNSLVAISQPVLSRCIRECSTILVRQIMRRWIRFPRNHDDRQRLQEEFVDNHGMPHIIGVVDGTHVALVPPVENENIYVNRKGYHSLNCQVICDSDLKILSMVTRWPGSSHDSFIRRQSTVGRAMQANFENGDTSSRIMGDSGYACLPWLLVPLPNPVTPRDHRFNVAFKRCRSVVETCIGLLKERFRCLLKERTLHYKPHTAARLILACATLHNMAIHYRVPHPDPRWDDIDIEELPVPHGAQQDLQWRQQGQAYRAQYIAQNF